MEPVRVLGARLSRGGSIVSAWGTAGDVPVPGDYDGDGITDLAVFRPSTGQWFVNWSSGGTVVTQWGTSGDIPVTGDQDGDGKNDFIVWRGGVWFTEFSAGGTAAVGWGTASDKPIGRVPGS